MDNCFKYEELTAEEKHELERIYFELNEGEIFLGKIVKIKMDYMVTHGNKIHYIEKDGLKWPLLVPNEEERTIEIDKIPEFFEKVIIKCLEILVCGKDKNV